MVPKDAGDWRETPRGRYKVSYLTAPHFLFLFIVQQKKLLGLRSVYVNNNRRLSVAPILVSVDHYRISDVSPSLRRAPWVGSPESGVTISSIGRTTEEEGKGKRKKERRRGKGPG